MPSIQQVRFTAASDRDRETGLLGFVSFVLDGLRIDGVALRRTRHQRLALSFPRRTSGRGTQHEIVAPIDDLTRRHVEQQVFRALGLDGSEEMP